MPNTIAKNYVAELNATQAAQLKEVLLDRGWEFGQAPYTQWKASKDKTTVAVYESGKLVVQGKGTSDLVLFLLEPEILKTSGFGYEAELAGAPAAAADEPFEPHIGVDESGKGDFFGPLVIAAVFVSDATRPKLLAIGARDSKTIKSDKTILAMAAKIRQAVGPKGCAVVPIGPESYNRLRDKFPNLNRLLAWGHARAIEDLLDAGVDCAWALSDKFGDERLIQNALMERGRGLELRQRTKAESDIAVAAASILARAEFVERLEKLGKQAGVLLPKGAGPGVDSTAAAIIKEKGEAALENLAKTHFATLGKARALAGR